MKKGTPHRNRLAAHLRGLRQGLMLARFARDSNARRWRDEEQKSARLQSSLDRLASGKVHQDMMAGTFELCIRLDRQTARRNPEEAVSFALTQLHKEAIQQLRSR